MQYQRIPIVSVFFKGKHNFNGQYTCWLTQNNDNGHAFIFKKQNNSFSHFFFTIVCIFALNEDCTAFLCFVFTLCV